MNILLKYKNKYIELSAPVKASIWFTICNILQKGISVITVPIFTRLLNTEQYGVYSIYQSWYQIITVFATLNLYYGVFNNGMLKFHNDKEAFTSSLQTLTTLITVCFFSIYLLFQEKLKTIIELSNVLIFAMFLELIFAPAYSFWAARQRYEFKYKKLVIITLIISVGSPILGVIFVLLSEKKAEARIISFVLVQVLIGLYFYVQNIRKSNKIVRLKYWKYALAFNLPLIPHYLSQSVLNQVDRIMISNMISVEKAAIYSVAYNVATLMILVTSAINNSFIPYTYKMLKEEKYNKITISANKLIVLVGICTLAVVLFGPEVIKIFAPTEYYEAIWVIPPVAVSVFFMFLYPLFGNIEFYFEENYFVMFASIFGAVANLLLNKIFIDLFGYLAAGYTTLVCYILFSLGHYIFMRIVIKKHIPGNKIYDLKFIAIFSILMIALMIIISILYEHTIIRYLIFILLCSIILFKKDYFIDIYKELMVKREEKNG